MSIDARNLPKEHSNNDEPGGEEENRRAEIISDNISLLEPVFTVDTLRKVRRTTIRFYPQVKSEAGIETWKFSARQEGKTLLQFAGKETPPSQLEWNISSENPNSPGKEGIITYSFTVMDSSGQTKSSKNYTLPVEKMTIERKRKEHIADREFEYYSLILFDFGKSGLRLEHRKVLDFIKNRVTSMSNIIITGHTDQIGDENINKRIATKRAETAAKILNLTDAKVLGIGEDELLYNNDLPEGRFYCRTVRIEIETPIGNGD